MPNQKSLNPFPYYFPYMPPSPPPSMASSIPHLYSNYNFTTSDYHHHLAGYPLTNNNTTSVMEDNNSTLWGCQEQHSLLMPAVFDIDQICDTMSSSAWMPNFIDQQVLDLAVPAAISDCNKMGFVYGGAGINNAGLQNFNSRIYQLPHVVGEECCGFVEDVKPPLPPPSFPNAAATENWGIQGNQIAAVEEPNIKVGRYSEEERKERILRYLKKRNQRNFNKTIKYACRKTLADRRVRVRGRFARNNEICEEDMATKKLHENHHHNIEDFYGADSFQFQLKNEDEDWLQEAMASLVYLSQSSPEDIHVT